MIEEWVKELKDWKSVFPAILYQAVIVASQKKSFFKPLCLIKYKINSILLWELNSNDHN